MRCDARAIRPIWLSTRTRIPHARPRPRSTQGVERDRRPFKTIVVGLFLCVRDTNLDVQANVWPADIAGYARDDAAVVVEPVVVRICNRGDGDAQHGS